MLIKWLGHSCFKIMNGEHALIIDPFEDNSVNGYRNISEAADVVLCSHQHRDHNASDKVILNKGKEDYFVVETLDSYHDDVAGAKRGNNTIHIIDVSGYRIAHLGDLGCPLDAKQIARLTDLDVLMIPVGGFYTIDGKVAADIVNQLKPKVTIPMHYRDGDKGYDVLAEVKDFVKYFDNVIYLTNDTLELSDELNDEIVVFNYE